MLQHDLAFHVFSSLEVGLLLVLVQTMPPSRKLVVLSEGVRRDLRILQEELLILELR